MAQEITDPNGSGIPAYLAKHGKVKMGNVDVTDQVIPRIKLLQALSPELQEYNDAKAGTFWHTIAAQNLGTTLMGVPIIIRKSYILWAPRNDDRGILARAMDGMHWDIPNAEFTVKPKGSANSVTYYTRNTVQESGLDQFGSSIPGDPRSVPAASLTYNMLWYFPEFPELSPSVIINTRSGVKPAQQLQTRIDSKQVAIYAQMYNIGITLVPGAEGPYFNYTYSGAGFVDEHTVNITESLYRRFADSSWVTNDEESDVADDGRAGRADKPQPNEAMASKF